MRWVIVLALLAPHAHASKWGDWCERHLIAHDPEPYYTATDEALERAYRREGARAYWERKESYLLRVIGREMRRRNLDTGDYDFLEP